MRDDAVDCEELMVPRVPRFPPGPSARQIAENKLTGRAVYRSWCRCVPSKGRAHARRRVATSIACGFLGHDSEDVLSFLCVKSRNSSTGCLAATAVYRKGVSDNARSCLNAFIASLVFKGISDNEPSLLSLIERFSNNLPGVELVLMTSPDGDHGANGLAVVGVREIEAQTRILRSQLEQTGSAIGPMKRIRCHR